MCLIYVFAFSAIYRVTYLPSIVPPGKFEESYINRGSDGAMLEDTRCTNSQRAVRRGGSLSTRTFLFFEPTNSCRLLVHKISYSWSLCSENIDFGRLPSS